MQAKESLDKVLKDIEGSDKEMKEVQSQLDQTEGKLEGVMERLEKEFGHDKIADAHDDLSTRQTDYDKKFQELLTLHNKLKEEAPWLHKQSSS
jgi:peptidoglycan hydrolase CwlO-like protein